MTFPKWGGPRDGAGRKRRTAHAFARHGPRPRLSGRCPLHVSLRLVPHLRSLRLDPEHAIVRDVLVAGARRADFRLVHYAVMPNHLHLVCEAKSVQALARGMKGLCVRLARALNRLWRRRGAIFLTRYHPRELRTPREVRNVLVYVLGNAQQHGVLGAGRLDPCSSAEWFDGWHAVRSPSKDAPPLPAPTTWLLRIGWRRHGLLPLPRTTRNVVEV